MDLVTQQHYKGDIVRIIRTGEKIDLFHFENQVLAIAEFLNLSRGDHVIDFALALTKLLADFFNRVEHLGHITDS